MYRSLFPRDLFAEMDRLTRDMQQAFELTPAIRGFARGGYPALNVGSTPTAVEIYAFAPGIDPAQVEVNLDRGVLTIAGERRATTPEGDAKTTLHVNERFTGRFRRVISLPDDIDANGVTADYRDGVLHVSVKRRESAQPRRIEVQ
ncbi:MAG: Hsp20/alpha crystallin family protein [Gammaproteobacteria bacterium]|uniref:Hsp20/alpha crystallin family protein n=1 Tax=Azohydromonas sp. TaxID=1872666 RepID=UPI002C4AA015|nr:Hsp20/alpha crystallin family protein [Azohydromonas sp.]HMM86123.1 Hsp20/alpha crystallin family protein [Azohydromonas sp.]